jgi:hypothetical protein
MNMNRTEIANDDCYMVVTSRDIQPHPKCYKCGAWCGVMYAGEDTRSWVKYLECPVCEKYYPDPPYCIVIKEEN